MRDIARNRKRETKSAKTEKSQRRKQQHKDRDATQKINTRGKKKMIDTEEQDKGGAAETREKSVMCRDVSEPKSRKHVGQS